MLSAQSWMSQRLQNATFKPQYNRLCRSQNKLESNPVQPVRLMNRIEEFLFAAAVKALKFFIFLLKEYKA